MDPGLRRDDVAAVGLTTKTRGHKDRATYRAKREVIFVFVSFVPLWFKTFSPTAVYLPAPPRSRFPETFPPALLVWW
jgi:hypothetical protein